MLLEFYLHPFRIILFASVSNSFSDAPGKSKRNEFYLHPFRILSWTRPANQSEIGYSLTQTVSYWCFDLAVVISVTSAYGRPVGVSIGQSANRSVGRSVCRFVRSVGRSVGRWVG